MTTANAKMTLRKMSEAKAPGITRGSNSYRLDLSIIQEEEGFNARDYDTPDVQEQIDTYVRAYLAADAAFDNDPKNSLNPGDACGEFEVRFGDDGIIYLTEGHLRRIAANRAKELGAKHIISVPVKEDKAKTKADSRARIITSQVKLHLKPLEQAKVYREMRDIDKLTVPEIASKVNMHEVHIIQTLQLLDLPDAIITLIREKKISAHPARELVRDYGEEQAIKMICMGVEIIPDGKKVTPKVIAQVKEQMTAQSSGDEEKVEQAGSQPETSNKELQGQGAGRSMPPQRKPAKRLSSKLVSSLRSESINIGKKLQAAASTVRLDSLADDDEVSLNLSLNKAELLRWIEFQQLLAEEGEGAGQNGDSGKQQLLMLPDAWQGFDYPTTHEEYSDLQERFENMTTEMGMTPGEKDEAWQWLSQNGTEGQLKNLRLMREAISMALQ